VCWATVGTQQASGFPVSLAWLPGKQLICCVVPAILPKRHQGTSGNCTSHLQERREGKNYVLILYILTFSYAQRYSGSQISDAVCGAKTLRVMMDFHFPDS